MFRSRQFLDHSNWCHLVDISIQRTWQCGDQRLLIELRNDLPVSRFTLTGSRILDGMLTSFQPVQLPTSKTLESFYRQHCPSLPSGPSGASSLLTNSETMSAPCAVGGKNIKEYQGKKNIPDTWFADRMLKDNMRDWRRQGQTEEKKRKKEEE